jgi:hypothetical protein
VLLALSIAGAACSGTPSASPSGSSAPISTGTSASPVLEALITSLPPGCDGGIPGPAATITFVAQGRAWAVEADGKGLTCLFAVADPGPFVWGPRADRVVLGGLEVRGVGSTASRPSGQLQPPEITWSRPTGSALVFLDATGKNLEKASVGGTTITNITPAESEGHFPAHRDVTFQDVTYHPSGGALGFVLTDTEGSSVWMSRSTGAEPNRLIWSHEGTVFGPIAFGSDGNALFYAVRLKDGTHLLSEADIKKAGVTTGLWKGKEDILRLLPSPDVRAAALDIGTGCGDRTATLSTLDMTGGRALLPAAASPTTVIGWTDDSTILVGEGGCDAPMKLWLVGTTPGATPQLLVAGADRGAVRVPDPTPAPPLPDFQTNDGFA